MTQLSLGSIDFADIADEFFRNTRVAYISSSLPAYKLCGNINHALDFDFSRRCDLDIMVELTPAKPLNFGLFDNVELEKPEIQYYPVYQYAIPHSPIDIYLISNQSGTHFLIPEMKHANYFLMIRQHFSLAYDDTLNAIINKVGGIDIVKDIPLSEFMYKEALIFE